MQGSDNDNNNDTEKPTCIVWTTHKPHYVRYPIDGETTIGYIKTLACSEWGIQQTALYYLRQIVPVPEDNAPVAWPDELYIPQTASGQYFEFVLECRKDGHDGGPERIPIYFLPR